MTKKKVSSDETITGDVNTEVSEPRYNVKQLKNSLKSFGCSSYVFDGAVAYATANKLINPENVSVSEMKNIIKKWLELPIK